MRPENDLETIVFSGVEKLIRLGDTTEWHGVRDDIIQKNFLLHDEFHEFIGRT